MIPPNGNTTRGGIALCLLLLAGARGANAPQNPPAPEPQEPGAYHISVDRDLVLLHATVRDSSGRFAPGLRAASFQVYEDGIPQSIRLFQNEDTPVTVGLVIDHSGSMRLKLDEVIAAARIFVQSSNPEDEMFVVNFNEYVSLGLPETIRFTNRVDELEAAILKTPADGMTALYDAVAKGLERLQSGNREKKVLVVISDGGDNASGRKLAHVLKMAEQSNALIYTIGIFDEEDPDRNPGVLKRLARATGGEAYIPGPFDPLASVCERIARDIRHQYTIGYVSTNVAQAGAYRAIRVVANAKDAGKLTVRTRAGYIAAGDPHPARKVGAQ
jgi:Ca-activated chloride channel homolog